MEAFQPHRISHNRLPTLRYSGVPDDNLPTRVAGLEVKTAGLEVKTAGLEATSAHMLATLVRIEKKLDDGFKEIETKLDTGFKDTNSQFKEINTNIGLTYILLAALFIMVGLTPV
jgi:predicted phage-related endonuclease